MRIDQILDRLECLVSDEREALRQVDAERAVLFAHEKEALFAALERAWPSHAPEDAQRFAEITPRLRENGILLAHARDCLRDALVAAGAVLDPTARATLRQCPTARPGLRLSVSG